MPPSSSEKPTLSTWLGTALITAFFAIFLIYPLIYILKKSLVIDGRLSLQFFQLITQNPIITQSITNSLIIALTVTLLSIATGFYLATTLTRTNMPLRNLLNSLILIPMILPPFVGAIGIKHIFGRFGTINMLLMQLHIITPRQPIEWLAAPFWGVVLIETLHLFPIMYLNIVSSYTLIDPTIEDAAHSLGATRPHLFRTITLPLLTPGIFAGASIIFIWAFTDLGTPLLFEYTTVVPVQIFNSIQTTSENLTGYALVITTLILTTALFLITKYTIGARTTPATTLGRTTGNTIRLSLPAKIITLTTTMLILALALIPHVSVLLVSIAGDWFMTPLPAQWTLAHYAEIYTHDIAINSIKNSLTLSALATILVLITGTATAYYLTRKKFPGRDILDTCAMLPLAIPGIVLAFGYTQTFYATPLDPRTNPIPLLIIAYAIRRIPLVVRALYAGFQQASTTFEEAAQNLGATPSAAIRTITLPIIRSSILGAAILAFAFSMLEVSDSLILAMQQQHYPITKAIYMLLGRLADGDYIASAMGILGTALLALALIITNRLLGKRLGDMFRT